MTSIGQKVKAALAALETARKALNAVDEDNAEIDKTHSLLSSLREELAETQRHLALTKEESVRDGAVHADWQKRHAEAQAKGNEEAARLQEQLTKLEQQITDARARHDNIRAGISALTQRLGMG